MPSLRGPAAAPWRAPTSLRDTERKHHALTRRGDEQAYKAFLRSAGIFDGVVDFDPATLDPKTGELKAEPQPNSSIGGPGDKLHPNWYRYLVMAGAVDLAAMFGKQPAKK